MWEKIKKTILNVKGNPLVNEPYVATKTDFSGLSQQSNSPVNYDTLIKYDTTSPEVITPISTIISDILSDGYYIESYDGGSGRNKKKEANNWLRRNKFKSAIAQPLLWDSMVSGDWYLYTPHVTDDEVNKKIESVLSKIRVFDKKRAVNKVYSALYMDYSFGTYSLVPLPASTIKIVHDEHQNILGYRQRVGGMEEDFTPEEVIHEKFLTMNGKVYGFTPMKAILSELSILAQAKDIIGYGLDKGGVPEHIFALEDESPKSPNVKNFLHQLRRFKEIKNRNRSLVVTGKVSTTNLTPKMSELMFKDLIDTFTKICMTVWGVPPAKMGMVGEKGSGYDSGLATEGYYKKIGNLQDWFYEAINWQLLIPKFGVQMIPNRSYLQDEVREAQVFAQKVDYGLKLWQAGIIKPEYITEKLLRLDEKYIGDYKPKSISMSDSKVLKDREVMDDNAKQEVDKKRKETQDQKVMEDIKSMADSVDDLMLKIENSDIASKDRYSHFKESLDDELNSMKDYLKEYKSSLLDEFNSTTDRIVDESEREIDGFIEKLESVEDDKV